MNILISGAGIAGITAALYLQRAGHEITIIDRTLFAEHRGYGISLKGFGVEIIKQLNLLDELLKKEILINQYTTYDASGNITRKFSKGLITQLTGGMIPVSRGDLHAILFNRLSPSVNKQYGLTIFSLISLSDQVLVEFDNGMSRSFDLVIVAEGIRSSTRCLLWEKEGVKQFDLTYAAGVIDIAHGFPVGEAKTFKGVGCSISFFPVTSHKLAIQASFRDSGSISTNFSKYRFKEHFAKFANEVIRLVDQIDETKMYYDKVGMVNVDTFFNGRVVLLGDAAHCPSFLSGMGASLSMLGAMLLAFQLNAPDNHVYTALSNYDAMMRPLAVHFKKNALANMNREIPPTPRAEKVTRFMLKHLPIPIIKRVVQKQLLVEEKLVKQILISTNARAYIQTNA